MNGAHIAIRPHAEHGEAERRNRFHRGLRPRAAGIDALARNIGSPLCGVNDQSHSAAFPVTCRRGTGIVVLEDAPGKTHAVYLPRDGSPGQARR